VPPIRDWWIVLATSQDASLTQQSRVRNVTDDVASTIHQSLPPAGLGAPRAATAAAVVVLPRRVKEWPA